jgi:hypothetical protein
MAYTHQQKMMALSVVAMNGHVGEGVMADIREMVDAPNLAAKTVRRWAREAAKKQTTPISELMRYTIVRYMRLMLDRGSLQKMEGSEARQVVRMALVHWERVQELERNKDMGLSAV